MAFKPRCSVPSAAQKMLAPPVDDRNYETTARPRTEPKEEAGVTEDLQAIPKELSAEAAVIGSMIIDPACIDAVRMFLKTPDQFFHEPNAVLFSIICELDDARTPIDGMILHRTLVAKNLLDIIGGVAYITECANAVPTSAHAEMYAAMVAEAATKRALLSAASATIKAMQETDATADEIYEAHEARLLKVFGEATEGFAVHVADGVHEFGETMQRRAAGEMDGIPTQYPILNSVLGGLHKSDVILVAARPSVGKSSLLLNLAENSGINLKVPSAFFSLEMSRESLIERLWCGRAGVDTQVCRRNKMDDAMRARMGQAAGEICIGNLWIDDTAGLTLVSLRSKIRRLVRQKGLEIAYVDYAQLLKCHQKGQNRVEEITAISGGIKELAKELKIPIVLAAQLNRSNEKDNRVPRISDLREGGSLENDADVVILIHREDVMHRGDTEWIDANPDKVNLAHLIVGKNRHGPTDSVKMTYLPHLTKFVNYDYGV